MKRSMVGTSAGVAGRMLSMERLMCLALRVGRGGGDGNELNFEGVENLAGGSPADLPKLDARAFQGVGAEVANVIVEPAGRSGVRRNGGRLEAEVGVILGDLVIDRLVVMSDRG